MLRREPGVEVETESGRYGELTVLVDGAVVARTNAAGWPPSVGTILAAVRGAPDPGARG